MFATGAPQVSAPPPHAVGAQKDGGLYAGNYGGQGRLLNWFAVIRRKTLRHVTFIGVTGSCGKTTTTRLVGAVLGSAGQCCMRRW